MKTLLRLSKLIAPLFPVMLLAVILGTAGHFAAIAIPLLGSAAIFGYFPAKFLILIGLGRGVLHYVEQYCNHFIAFTILARIRNIVFTKLRSLGPARLEGKEKGNLITVLTADVELLEVFYAHTVSPVCIALLVSAGMTALFAKINWVLAVIAACFYVTVGFILPAVMGPLSQKAGVQHRKEFAALNSFLLDCLRGLEMSILYGTGSKKLSQIKEKSDELAHSQGKMAGNEGITAAVSGLFVTAAGLTMLFTSLYMYRNGAISFEQVIMAVTAMFSSFGPVIAVANLGSGLSQTVACGKRVLSLLDEKPVVEEVKGGKEIEFTGAKAVDVTFGYGNETVLHNINMTFPKGKIIGIQGKSGSGKSTLLKLFMHFWEANSGAVNISGNTVNGVNTKCLRKIEGYVTQETILFHDTIENNIRIAKLDATSEEIQEACKKAAIHEFIMSLPQGYQTQVAELGDNFSGGERQRLGLARAFLHNADFLLLDEPTSNLDTWNEKQIMDAVKATSKDKTVIVVSHRDSTFEHADRVYKIGAGKN